MTEAQKTKKILIVNRKPPHGSLAMKDGIDTALICSAFGQKLSVLFMDDGVYQLLKDQNPASTQSKDHASTFAAFEMYDVNDIYVDIDAMTARGIAKEDLIIETRGLSNEEIGHLMENQDVILNS